MAIEENGKFEPLSNEQIEARKQALEVVTCLHLVYGIKQSAIPASLDDSTYTVRFDAAKADLDKSCAALAVAPRVVVATPDEVYVPPDGARAQFTKATPAMYKTQALLEKGATEEQQRAVGELFKILDLWCVRRHTDFVVIFRQKGFILLVTWQPARIQAALDILPCVQLETNN